VDRFHHEAKVLVQLNHSNIAQVYDMGEVDSSLYMAIEYVAGVDLSRVVDRARASGTALPIPVALRIGQQMCEALGYAHRKVGADGAPLGIVHRDISPQNVMVSYEGEVKVIDFGLAKSTARSKHTLPSTVLGKLGYMSPEQARAEQVDHRSDIYSAGIVIWELLAGRALVQGGTVGEMVAKMANPRVPSLRESRPEVSEAVEKLVLRALQTDPSGRYNRADELARSINEVLVRENLSVSSEDVGNYVRAMCPEEFAAERQLQSRLSMMRKKGGSSPDATRTSGPAFPLATPAAHIGTDRTQVRTPTGGLGSGPQLTAAQKAMSVAADVQAPSTAPEMAYAPGAQLGTAPAPQVSVELKVPKSRAPMVIVLLLVLLALGGGGFFAWREYGEQLLGKASGSGGEVAVVEPPPKKEPEKELVAEKPNEPAKEEPAKEKVPPKEEAKADPGPPVPLEKIEVKGPVMKVIRDGEHWYVQLLPKVKLQEGDQVKLVGEPLGKNQRQVYGVAPVVESRGALARVLLDEDTRLPPKAFAVKDEAPRRTVKADRKATEAKAAPAEAAKDAAKEPAKDPAKETKEEPPKEAAKDPAKEAAKETTVAKVDPPPAAPTTVAKEEPKADPPPRAGSQRVLTGGIVLGSGVFKKVHIYNRSDFAWHGCELRLPNRTYYRYEADDEISAGEADGILFTKFKDDSRPEDPQAAHGWALVRCKEGAGYLQFKTN
jgi:hypothetical protein